MNLGAPPPTEIVNAIRRMSPAQRADAIAFIKRLRAQGVPLLTLTVVLNQRDEAIGLAIASDGEAGSAR